MAIFLVFFLFWTPLGALANEASLAHLEVLKGITLDSSKEVNITPQGEKNKALVVLFLSAKCPCSNSHIGELKKLSQDFSKFQFVAVHSNRDESQEQTQTYFKSIDLPFPVIQDQKSKLADLYKAFKTPHAFVVMPDGTVAYQGGVSSSHDFKQSKRNFLREALEDLQSQRKVRTPEGRTLGCSISREDAEN